MTENRKKILKYTIVSIFAGFIVLTILVSLFPTSWLDHEFSEEIQEHQYPFLDTLMKLVSWPGYFPRSVVIVAVTAAIFALVKKVREAFFIFLTLISGVFSHFLKILIDRPRPTDDFVRIIVKARHQSFPSGHVLFYVVFFGFIALLMVYLKDIYKPVRMIAGGLSIVLIFSVPFSRIYLGAHWFTDVLGGVLLGILILFAISYFYLQRPGRKHN